MTKVLFISEWLNVAGTETFMMNVVRYSNKQQFQYDFLLFRKSENDYVREAEDLGSTLYFLPSRRESVFRYLSSLNSFFKTHAIEYNAVHWCGGAVSSIAPLYFAYKYKIPVRIVHSHNSSCSGFHTLLLHTIFKKLLPKICTHFFACSTLAAEFFFGKKPSVIIKNGIALDRFSFNETVRGEFRRRIGASSTEIVIGHVGRLTEVKNQTFILDIANELSKRGTEYRIVFIGKGELMESLKQKASRLNLDEKVLFVGESNEISKWMQAFDVFLMSSLYEGLPFVLVEAQAAGLPCVISDTINKDAVLTPNVGQLSLREDVGKWCDEVQNMYSAGRSDTRKCMIEKGFSITDTIKYLEGIYSKERAI